LSVNGRHNLVDKMLSPDKYIRKAYGTILSGIGCPIYDMVVPKDKEILPLYVLITTQTKRPNFETQCGHDWDCTILLDIIATFQNGFADRAVVDDLETKILTAIDTWTFDKTEIAIQPFHVYNTEVDDSHDDFLTTPSKTIVRKLLRFRHFVGAVNNIVS